MQAKLPDVNAAIVRYRSQALECYTNNDHVGSWVCFSAINALMPEEYKVEVNTKKYDQLTQDVNVIVCKHCTHENPRNLITSWPYLLPKTEQLFQNTKYREVWTCLKCKEINFLSESVIKRVRHKEPYYFSVVPDVPKKKLSLNRTSFQSEFQGWFKVVLQEIESKIGKYRADYAAQQEAEETQIHEDD